MAMYGHLLVSVSTTTTAIATTAAATTIAEATIASAVKRQLLQI